MSASVIPCSVLILTRNSGETLNRCLQNLGAFDEVLIHDGNSTDATLEIARRHGAMIKKQVETDEPLVRVQDFTAMRLKQRDDARNDWVLYLDSDEWISDEAIAEIRGILATAEMKTIIKIPRYAVIDGKICAYGYLSSEIVPRIHHRRSGCTLKRGVHEKYVYGRDFREISLQHALYNITPPYEQLQSKDNRYITLEIERIWREGYSWPKYLRWVLLREPLIMFYLAVRILGALPRYWRNDAVPLKHDWRFVRYHWRLFRGITGAMLARPFTAGKKA